MKKFAVFINTDTIIDMKFVEMKIISECGDFAEITKDPKGISLVIYNERLSCVLDWENNFIDIDHRNMIDEIYFFLNQNSISNDISDKQSAITLRTG